ncbi:MAG: phosphoglucosamine mutase [Acidimicrobiales bacterium]
MANDQATDFPTFGTDGVRGVANTELTPAVAQALGRAAAEVLGGTRAVVGRDPRRSGPMLEAALVAGYLSAGVDVELLGVVPTPTVAHAAAADDVSGAMISASHNPFADNGIKLFAPGGVKLRDDTEAAIQARFHELCARAHVSGPTGSDVGVTVAGGGASRWIEAVVDSVPADLGAGLSIVLDCANGAASELGPEVFRSLGADVTVIGAQPDGININDGVGSTHPASLCAAVTETGADLGLAFDGDADRLIAVDDRGQVVDGDHILSILAESWRDAGTLRHDTVVVTVMSNLGFHRAMAAKGIEVVTTRVGDRYVLEALDDGGFSLGGEQSGHVICRDLASTGDGVLAGAQLVAALRRADRPLSAVAADAMTTVPQILRNVRITGAAAPVVAALGDAVARAEAEMGDEGRVLVRPSGTEPLVRVMIEHLDAATAERICDELVAETQRLVG